MQIQNVATHRLAIASIRRAIGHGWDVFSRARPLSVSFSMIFAAIGLFILVGIEQASVAPMMLPVAGGFMLVGPVLLSGYFAVADRVADGKSPEFSDIISGFSRVNRGMGALALVCMLLFLIWMTDAATLYGFMVGRTPTSLLALLPPPEHVWSFVIWSSVMGAVLALVIFSISAFAVPLLFYRRASLVQAVVLSARMVFSNFVPCILWAILLAAATIGSILILPLFLVTFPVLAFASHALYRELFPDQMVTPKQ